MHSCLDAVIHLKVELRKLVLLVSTSFLDISEGRGVNNVADNESANGLILGDGLSSRDASVKVTRTASLVYTFLTI